MINMMEHQIILPLEEEETNLELHTKLCSQRYQQLLSKFDHVDNRLDRLELHVVEIKDAITGINTNTSSTYLKWAGVIIGLLGTFSLGLVTHLILR